LQAAAGITFREAAKTLVVLYTGATGYSTDFRLAQRPEILDRQSNIVMWPLVRQARYLRRYRQIAQVLVHHGFGLLVDQLGLASLLSLPRRVFRRPPSNGLSAPERLRAALAELGPTFVKLGQMLSTRPDLLGPAWILELNKLQDTVPPFPFEVAAATIEADLGRPLDTIFRSFTREPLAAASLGQAHAAVLHDGTQVVVKVQRPDIEGVVAVDLAILNELAALAQQRTELGKQYDLTELAWEFGATLRAELDYRREARNAERFRKNFAASPYVKIPQVYWEYSAARVLTTERLFGVKINDITGMDAMGLDRPALARNAVELILQEIFSDGFFQGDPHPGNLFAMQGGIIGAVDFGQAVSLDREMTGNLLLLLAGLTRGDADGALRALQRLGMLAPRQITGALRRDMQRFIERFVDRPLREISGQEIAEELLALSQRHRLRMPAPLALLLKAIVMMEGIGVLIDPQLDVFGVARPYVTRALADLLGPEAQVRRALERGRDLAETAGTLPRLVSDALQKLNDGELTLRTHEVEARRLASAVGLAGTRLALGLVLLASTIGLGLLGLIITLGGWAGAVPTLLVALLVVSLVVSGVALLGSLVRREE
jgi:ubiquinone biosynthesis protein